MGEKMTIGDAVAAMRAGKAVARSGWNGKDMYLFLVEADQERNVREFVMMRTAQGDLVPWLCSQSDLLCDDWVDLTELKEEAE